MLNQIQRLHSKMWGGAGAEIQPMKAFLFSISYHLTACILAVILARLFKNIFIVLFSLILFISSLSHL